MSMARRRLQEIPRSTWSNALERLMTRWPMAIYRAQPIFTG